MRTPFLLFVVVGVLGAMGAPLAAQEQPVHRVAGQVRSAAGAPVEEANVFLLETLEGALTGASGDFAFESRRTGSATLVVRHPSYAEQRLALTLPLTGPVQVALAEVFEVDAILVSAGGYAAGDERGATLTSLEVVTTPGAQADVAMAIKTLPGVQNVDEGSGLFVRGGDQAETKIFLNDAVVINPLRLEEPTGSITPTVDPFLLDGIFFSSGGFGARYGNALSAVVDLSTQGRPGARSMSLGANLAGVDASFAVPLGSRLGARGTASRWHIGPIFAVNGSTRDYPQAPQGYDASGSVIWSYRPGGELKAFAIGQTTDLEVEVEEATFAGTYALDAEGGALVATWRDLYGSVAPAFSVSRSGLTRSEESGAFRLRSELVSTQIFGETAWSPIDRWVVTAGAEWERLAAGFDGRLASRFDDRSEDAETVPIVSDRSGERNGAFVESRFLPWSRLSVTTGVRTDGSTLTGERTFDPRLSAAVEVGAGTTLLMAWGVYHQVPDPLLFEPAVGGRELRSMRARQLVLGAQIGAADAAFARVEAYHKEYEDLAQTDSDKAVVEGGVGTSRGVDVFVKGTLPGGVRGRAAYSLVDAERTDPDTGVLARAAQDVTHSLTAIAERGIGEGWTARAAYRYATGRPFTDVVGAAFDPARDVWVPEFGPPFAARVPDFHRLDLAASHLRQIGGVQAVFFASLSNLFDRENVLEFRWSEDYSERFPVRSRQKRSVFFGISVQL